MKRVLALMFLLVVIGLVSGDTTVSRVQDPATVNAKSISVKLDNPRVRVLDVTLKPGEKENTHSHPAYVVYVIEGGKVRNHASDGKVVEYELKTGEVVYRDPLTHWAENIGNTTLRLVVVELKN